jgi:hypothetical protein
MTGAVIKQVYLLVPRRVVTTLMLTRITFY